MSHTGKMNELVIWLLLSDLIDLTTSERKKMALNSTLELGSGYEINI